MTDIPPAVIAHVRYVASHGKCNRRQIGASIYTKDFYLLGSSWNGPFNGVCECPGRDVPAGAGNAACYGIHAEQRALMYAERCISIGNNNDEPMSLMVCTKAPCKACVLVLLGTPIQRICFLTPSNETENRELWTGAGRQWECIE